MKNKLQDLKGFYDIKSKEFPFGTNAGSNCQGSCGDCGGHCSS